MEGANSTKAVRDRGMLEVQLDTLNIGNQQLAVIQKRLAVIRDNLFGKHPEIEEKRPGNIGLVPIPAPLGAANVLRDHIERSQAIRDNINELLGEIESFI